MIRLFYKKAVKKKKSILHYTLSSFVTVKNKKKRSKKKRGRGMVGPGRPQFVLFGSSIVQFSFAFDGWGSILSDIYSRKADIVLRGYSGWTSRNALQVLDRVFPKDHAAVQPSLVIVYFGGNDSVLPHPSGLGPHVPLPEYIANMTKIALHLKSLSEETRLIFLTTPPVNEKQIHQALGIVGRTDESCRIYAEACVKLCKELDVKVVDLWTAFKQKNDWATTCFTDGIHLTSEGSKIIVKQILKTLREAEWQPSLHWSSLPTEFGEVSLSHLPREDGQAPLSISDIEYSRYIRWE